MKVLVINTGSSSIKYQVFDMTDERVLAKGLIECIGLEGSRLKHNKYGCDAVIIERNIKNHHEAVGIVIETLLNSDYGVLDHMKDISAVGHRIAHGGEKISKPVIINEKVVEVIKESIELAPLHNPPMLEGIKAFAEVLPGVPMTAVFDTAFHQSMPENAYLYAIPYEYYLKYGIRRYGFHGTSHKYVTGKAADIMGKPFDSLKIVSCHLGNGSSIAAVNNGKSIDTSMGFTPVDGLPMGTRSGSIDPFIISFLMNKENLTINQVDNIINKKSGFLGVSGVSSDWREIVDASQAGNERAKKAVDLFCYNIRKYIGAYAAAMEGLDCIVFTAGIGENSPLVRRMSCKGLDFLGVSINEDRNQDRKLMMEVQGEISSFGSKVKVYVINTNEELMIARETMQLVKQPVKNVR